MVTLTNSILTVDISEQGAEIKSIRYLDKEYMWSSDPKFWAMSAPIMFPMCGGLKGGKYELDGKTYEMGKHGFAKLNKFDVESQSETKATFVLYDNEMTRKMYPFTFAFRVMFELDGASLKVTYDAENLDNKTMYCTFGSHEAYVCPEGIEEYEIVFPEKETLYAYGLNGDIVTDYTKLMVDNSNTLVLNDKNFFLDALVFKDVKSKSATLVNKNGNRKVTVDFDGFDYLVLWHKYTSPYLCIEPWCGLPDVTGSSYDFTEKVGMRAINPGEHFARTHTITVG